jgi:hypothetical protein
VDRAERREHEVVTVYKMADQQGLRGLERYDYAERVLTCHLETYATCMERALSRSVEERYRQAVFGTEDALTIVRVCRRVWIAGRVASALGMDDEQVATLANAACELRGR